MTHYFKEDDKDVVNNGTASTDQRNMYPNSGINAAAAVAASRHPVSSINALIQTKTSNKDLKEDRNSQNRMESMFSSARMRQHRQFRYGKSQV